MSIKAVISLVAAIRVAGLSLASFFLKGLSVVIRSMALLIRRLLRTLVSIAKLMDSTLSRLNFGTPAPRKLRHNYRAAATLLLVGLSVATISGVLAFKFISIAMADSSGVKDNEVAGQNDGIKFTSLPPWR